MEAKLKSYARVAPALHDVTIQPDTTATATASSRSTSSGVHADASVEDHEFSSDEEHRRTSCAATLSVRTGASSGTNQTRRADIVVFGTSATRVRCIASVSLRTVAGKTTLSSCSAVTSSTSASLAAIVALLSCAGARH